MDVKANATRLSEADKHFIRFMVPESYESVMDAYAARPERWTPMTGAGTGRSLFRNLAAYVRLLLRAVKSVVAPSVLTSDVVCADYEATTEDARRAYLNRFLPGAAVAYLPIGFGLTRWPKGVGMGRFLGGLLGAILRVRSGETGDLGCRYVHIAEYCLMVLAAAQQSRRREAYLFRMYQVHVPVLAGFLRFHGVTTHLVAATTPLTRGDVAIPGDSMKLAHPFQAFQFDDSEALGVERFEMWGPTEIIQMESAYQGRRSDGDPDTVAVYTQGYWLRLALGTATGPKAEALAAVEDELMCIVERYLGLHDHVRTLIFLHPMERRHYRERGVLGPWSLLGHPRAECIVEQGRSSNEEFDRARVGITTFSTVGHDRIYMGFPTLFYRGEVGLPSYKGDQPFAGLFHTEERSLLDALDTAMGWTAEQFMMHYVGGLLDSAGFIGSPRWLPVPWSVSEEGMQERGARS